MGYKRRDQAPDKMAAQSRYQHQEARKRFPCPSSVSPLDARQHSANHWEKQFGMKWRRRGTMSYMRRYRAPDRMAPRPRHAHQEACKSVPCPSSVSPLDARPHSIKQWEEQFGMKWRRFLTSKKYISEADNVVAWDDSGAKESFFNAERRFWSTNCLSNAHLPSPDLYIDCIDWASRIDPLLLMELEAARQDRNKVPAMEIIDNRPRKIDWEVVKPTGWDVCGDHWSNLTSMVVGGT